MNRRQFLSGVSAVATAAALPASPIDPRAENWALIEPMFLNVGEVYRGVVVREIYDVRMAARVGLKDWYGAKYPKTLMGEVV